MNKQLVIFLICFAPTINGTKADFNKIELLRKNEFVTTYRLHTQEPEGIVECSRIIKWQQPADYQVAVYKQENPGGIKLEKECTDKQINKQLFKMVSKIFGKQNPNFDWTNYRRSRIKFQKTQ